MERLKAILELALVMLALCGCTCGIVGCASGEVEAEQPSRFDVEYVTSHGKAYHLDYLSVDLITDKETGQRWLVVCTEHGVAMAPLEEE